MRLLFMIVCLFLAAEVYAGQAKDANGNDVRQEAKDISGSYVQQEAPKGVPGWAGVDAEPPFSDRQGLQPSYDRTDEPPFSDDRNHE